ncbi:MAG: hypothetical protein NC548_61555 [Lachnospiraceae bacterium]|nr:hypothetical protein [Lachnospiraceae bacterium]MCM1235524.1 hypothetical protein [Ruminococcus flavefaciens]
MRIAYKNIGTVTKKFHGVEFKPGETKVVEGYINASSFIRINNSALLKNSKLSPAVTSKTEPAPKVEPKVEAKPDSKTDVKKTDSKKDETLSEIQSGTK